MLALGLILLGLGIVCFLAKSDHGCGSDHVDVTHNDGSKDTIDWVSETRRETGRLDALGEIMIERLDAERKGRR